MTIKKLGISAATAAVLASSAFAAGTLTVSGGINSISSELIDSQDVNVSFSNPLTYTNGMSASSATEPGFELTISGATMNSTSGANLVVKVADGEGYTDENTTVATFDRLDGGSVIFSTVADQTVERTKKYMIVSDDGSDSNGTHSHVNTVDSADLNVSLAQGTATVNAQIKLWSNSGDSELDTATAQILETATQFSGSFGNRLNAQIDASQSFALFENTNTTTAESTTKDDFTFTVANDKDITYPATATKFDVNITADADISAINAVDDANTDAVSVTGAWADNDFNGTVIGTDTIYMETTATNHDNNGSITEDMGVTIDGTTTLGVTNFTATGKVYFDNGATKTLFSNSAAGTWSIYGYQAQIPNVVGTATIDTTFKFTNRSSLDTEIYFTLVDPDGTVATLNSVTNTELASLASNNTGSYKASELVALVNDANFDSTGSFSVEVSIPTTPTSVYGMASFKNKTLGQFKDLPVYNSSSMGY